MDIGMILLLLAAIISIMAMSNRSKMLMIPRRAPRDRRRSSREPVLLGASVPDVVRPGEEFTARFVAYIESVEDEIADKLLQLSPRGRSVLGYKSCRWQLGTEVKVRLYGKHIKVVCPEEHFTWDGRYNIIDFDVRVAPWISNAATILRFDVLIGEIVVAKLRIDLDINSEATANYRKVVGTEPVYTAFASYASDDRMRVLDRVAEIQRNDVDVFLDCLSLHPGEYWKRRLRKEIIDRDLFLLFWSMSAKDSEWVTWEWRTALKNKGLGGIDPHPLDRAEPPTELKRLHFGDPYMLAREAYKRDFS